MSLLEWTSISDTFSHTDLVSNWNAVDGHDHSSGKGVQIPTAGLANSAVSTAKIATGAVTSGAIANLAVGTAQLADSGVTLGKLDPTSVAIPLGLGSTRRGAVNISATESRTNTAYGTLTTPDQVTVTLPANGLLRVHYQATWQESVSAAASATIFVGANQLKMSAVNGPVLLAPGISGTANTDVPLYSFWAGLASMTSGTGYSGDATTGQTIGTASGGGPCYIFAAAGTYTVSVQFKASSGSVTAKNRKLWVSTWAP